jgi:hypothetical protein
LQARIEIAAQAAIGGIARFILLDGGTEIASRRLVSANAEASSLLGRQAILRLGRGKSIVRSFPARLLRRRDRAGTLFEPVEALEHIAHLRRQGAQLGLQIGKAGIVSAAETAAARIGGARRQGRSAALLADGLDGSELRIQIDDLLFQALQALVVVGVGAGGIRGLSLRARKRQGQPTPKDRGENEERPSHHGLACQM